MTNLEILQIDVGEHLDEIKALFKPGAKITVVVRNPEVETVLGGCDMVCGDDDLDQAVAAIKRRQAKS